MNNLEIETWVFRILEIIQQGKKYEDSRVELKSEWPNPRKAARQIAGHANFARGELILWLIGIDEKSGVVDFKDEEISQWIAKYKNEFEAVSPEIKDIIVPYNSQKIVALLIKTDRFPYVVKNPLFGTAGQGPIQYEIPWRENASTRTAKREDVIRLISPIIRSPQIELMDSKLICERKIKSKEIDHTFFSWLLQIEIYIIPVTDVAIIIPFHKCSAIIRNASFDELIFNEVALRPPASFAFHAKGSIYIEDSQSEILIQGPGKVKVYATMVSDSIKLINSKEIIFEVNISPISSISEI
jgi:hypothetical protein